MANSLHWRAFCLLLCLVSAPLLGATPPAPQRIITLTPHLTELLYDIGAGDRIVATDDASDFPAEVATLPRVANYRSINLEALLALKPDLVVAWRSAQARMLAPVEKLGIPVFSYIPPSAWAWRKGRAKKCAALADTFVAIFPHELPVYEAAGANISFLGNPLVDTVKAELPEKEARAFFGIAPEDHAVLLMPGSRRQEIELLLPDMLGAAKRLLRERPGTRFYLPVADGVDEGALRAAVDAAGVPVMLTHEARYALMGLMDAAIATSGTVVMEAALMGLPCVSLYRLAPLNYMIGRALVHVEHFTLPNILLGETIQPELLQDEVEPHRIADALARLYRGEAAREKTRAKLQEACQRLGPPGAAGRVAAKILEAAHDKRHSGE